MKLWWTNKCKENNFRCPYCQNMIGNKDGQMSKSSKNHKIMTLGGTVKCVVCNTTVGYFANNSLINGELIKMGMADKVLENVDYVTAIQQKDF